MILAHARKICAVVRYLNTPHLGVAQSRLPSRHGQRGECRSMVQYTETCSARARASFPPASAAAFTSVSTPPSCRASPHGFGNSEFRQPGFGVDVTRPAVRSTGPTTQCRCPRVQCLSRESIDRLSDRRQRRFSGKLGALQNPSDPPLRQRRRTSYRQLRFRPRSQRQSLHPRTSTWPVM